MDKRYYVTTLPFARDLCEAINVGINNPPAPATQEPRADVEASPSKYSNYSEMASRKRLGKRMLKLLQPSLEAALKAEAEVCRTPYEPLRKELEGILEASVEARQPSASRIIVSHDGGITPGQSQDVDMADAPAESQIIVADHSEGEEDAEGEPDDAHLGEDNIEVSYYDEPTPKPNGLLSAAHSVSGDHEHKESTPHLTNGSTKPSNSPPSLPGASYTHLSANNNNNSKPNHAPGTGPLTPPQSNTGSASFTAGTAAGNPLITVTAANNNTSTHNPLTDGGILWYLADFQLRGTTAVDPDSDDDDLPDHLNDNEDGNHQGGAVQAGAGHNKQQLGAANHPSWTTNNGREAEVVRGVSEELTDMDEEALRDLEFDVDEEMTITIAGDGGDELSLLADGGDGGDGDGDGDLPDGEGDGGVDAGEVGGGEDADADGDGGGGGGHRGPNGGGVGMLAGARKVQVGGLSGSPRKRTRSEVAKAAVNGGRLLRKGVRSSARRK